MERLDNRVPAVTRHIFIPKSLAGQVSMVLHTQT